MIISIASGKGGTGKTTVAVSLALSLKNVQLLDCDVEEPNDALFLNPRIRQTQNAVIPVPEIDQEKCTNCGTCAEACAYNALAVIPPKEGRAGTVMVFPQLCHGCGACSYLCPVQAIREVPKRVGVVESGDKGELGFVQGKLDVGEAMGPPVIRQVKALINHEKTVILDASPGTSCPMITAVQKSDFCILVTEPTPFGLHDLVLAVEALRKLQIPFGVIMNRSDLGNDRTERYCEEQGIPILMRIPFDKKIARAYSQGNPVVQIFPEYKEKFQALFQTIKEIVNSK